MKYEITWALMDNWKDEIKPVYEIPKSLGEQGWQLISVVLIAGTTVGYFQREKKEN